METGAETGVMYLQAKEPRNPGLPGPPEAGSLARSGSPAEPPAAVPTPRFLTSHFYNHERRNFGGLKPASLRDYVVKTQGHQSTPSRHSGLPPPPWHFPASQQDCHL